ncbi:hypothetical protein C9374_007297 [Naegleria lovaniensis]|uniref:Uncharacterized protein n=1 Tax=Naegleria lovaniensis TaxID=51637 RepID=A0AA88H4W0_NAELO|nr:uncharacterized protein C9374_007297 [Naegleria lovaniensis]KAG2393766.1 hypothetical protein C9374_007297 [Naegleria lovaniensis]
MIARNIIIIPKHIKHNNKSNSEEMVFRKLNDDEAFNNVNAMNIILEEYYLDYFMMPSTFYDECCNIGFCFIDDDHLKFQTPYCWKYIYRGLNSIRKITESSTHQSQEEMKLLLHLFGCPNPQTLKRIGNKLFKLLFENSQHVSKDSKLRERNFEEIPFSLKFEKVIEETSYQIFKYFTPDGKRLFWNTRAAATIFQQLWHHGIPLQEESVSLLEESPQHSPSLLQIIRLLLDLFVIPYDRGVETNTESDDMVEETQHNDTLILKVLNPIELTIICKAFLKIHQLISILLIR